MEKIYYYVHKDTLAIEKNSDNLKNTCLFPLLEENDGKHGYDYLDSSTKDSDVNDDVGPGYDLGDYDYCNNIERDDKNEDGTLSRKILHDAVS